MRAGFGRPLAAGVFSYLPPAKRPLDKISGILREEREACGGQEVSMPVVHPAEIRERSGRHPSVGPELVRLRDRRDRAMVLVMTHEEVVAGQVAGEMDSYQQLPRLVYRLQTKFRDGAQPRAGLIRAREFMMKDAYSLDPDEEGLDRQYRALHRAYFRIFARCGLPAVAAGVDVGITGGSLAHEFMYPSPVGEDTILCDGCGYTANRQVAVFRKLAQGRVSNPPLRQLAWCQRPVRGGGGLNRPVFVGMMVCVRSPERYAPDLDAYHERARTGPCSVCGIVARDPDSSDHHIVYEDEDAIAFFNRRPTQRGYTLVAPKEHREQAAAALAVKEYLVLQRVVCRVAEAVRGEVGAERMYVMSVGSNQGNAHVHRHVVPLLPGTPYDEQQFVAVMLETAGAWDMPEAEKAPLAARTSRRMGSTP